MVDMDGHVLMAFLPGILLVVWQATIMKVVEKWGLVWKKSMRVPLPKDEKAKHNWRLDPANFKEVGNKIAPGISTLSPGWYAQGHPVSGWIYLTRQDLS